MYRRFLRPGWIFGHLMVVLAVVVCLRLGWWQWDRTHEADGTIQNLGYAILWPVFGGAFVYMWFRFLQLELLKDAEDDAELTRIAAGPSTDEEGDATFEPDSHTTTDLTPADVGSDQVAVQPGEGRDPESAADAEEEPGTPPVPVDPTSSRTAPSRGYTVAVSTVGDEIEDDDPELAAYNRALAALAEKDHRRAR